MKSILILISIKIKINPKIVKSEKILHVFKIMFSYPFIFRFIKNYIKKNMKIIINCLLG
jgi:hypothetical protein